MQIFVKAGAVATLVLVSGLSQAVDRLPAGQGEPSRPKLRYVVVLTRHGVRSPTWALARLNEYSASPWPDFGVPPGELTPYGRIQMKNMGAFYREYFAARGLLKRQGCLSPKLAYLHADKDQRTLETGRAMLEGLEPGCKGEVHTHPGKQDPLFEGAERADAPTGAEIALAAIKGRIGPRLEAMLEAHRPAFDLLESILKGGGKARRSIFDEPVSLSADGSGVRMAGPLRLASTFTENLLLEYANGMRDAELGWGRLDAAKLQQVMALHTAYADLLRRTPAVAVLRGSELLARIVASMEQAVTNKPVAGGIGPSSTKLLVLSGHDTNISNLSGLLGLNWLINSYQPDDVPPGGALVFSVWQTAGTSAFSVRIQFVTQTLDQMHTASPPSLEHPPEIADLFVPGCSSAAEGYPCTWSGLRNLAVRLTRGAPAIK